MLNRLIDRLFEYREAVFMSLVAGTVAASIGTGYLVFLFL